MKRIGLLSSMVWGYLNHYPHTYRVQPACRAPRRAVSLVGTSLLAGCTLTRPNSKLSPVSNSIQEVYLSNASVHDEDDIVGSNGVGHGQHLLEQALLLLVPSTRIDNYNLKTWTKITLQNLKLQLNSFINSPLYYKIK